MDKSSLYGILKDITVVLSARDPGFPVLPDAAPHDTLLNDLGLDIITLPDILAELKKRLGGRDLGLDRLMNPADVNSMSLDLLLKHIQDALSTGIRNPLIVYVDDEEENIFIFQRKFGKRFNIKAFTDSREALAFIKASDDVALVITDEVMPHLGGNQLCDEVHKAKPTMKFILITGNPNSDGDLMYRSLRSNRFYDFISKPVDFAGKGEEYYRMFSEIIGIR